MKVQMNIFLLFISIASIISFRPFYVGHRGGYTGVENTAEAYNAGVDKYGFQAMECDVRLSKDLVYVINHNKTLVGSKGSMVVEETTLAELKTNEITQTRGGITYHGVICTMEEYLKICKEKHAAPMIELKATTGINETDMSMFAGLVDLVKKYQLEKKAFFISFMMKSMEYVHKNFPELRTQLIMNKLDNEKLNFLVKYKMYPTIETGGISMDITDRLHNRGLFAGVWNINTKENYVKFANMGVYTLSTDMLPRNQTVEIQKRWPDIPEIETDDEFYSENRYVKPLEEWEIKEAERIAKEEIREIEEYDRKNKKFLDILN